MPFLCVLARIALILKFVQVMVSVKLRTLVPVTLLTLEMSVNIQNVSTSQRMQPTLSALDMDTAARQMFVNVKTDT